MGLFSFFFYKKFSFPECFCINSDIYKLYEWKLWPCLSLLRSSKEGLGHYQRPLHQHSPTSSVTSVGSLSRAQSSTLSSMLSASHSSHPSFPHQQPQSQGEHLHIMGPRSPQGSQQGMEPVTSGLLHLVPQKGPTFPPDPYGSTPRLHHQQQLHHPCQQQQHFQGPPQSQLSVQAGHFPLPHPYAHVQGEPYAMMARAQQMVDVLTEENRMLRQEMDACREKVTKLHKVTSALAFFVPGPVSAAFPSGRWKRLMEMAANIYCNPLPKPPSPLNGIWASSPQEHIISSTWLQLTLLTIRGTQHYTQNIFFILFFGLAKSLFIKQTTLLLTES